MIGLAQSDSFDSTLQSKKLPGHAAPSDSSVGRHQWEDDGGPCDPASDGPFCRHVDAASRTDHGKEAWRHAVELVSLPFNEYSAVYPERLDWLRTRLMSSPAAGIRYIIVDVTRVSLPGGLLLGVLHAAAGRLLKEGRCLVLVGNLNGLVSVSHLSDLCQVTESREAAFAWCREQLDKR